MDDLIPDIRSRRKGAPGLRCPVKGPRQQARDGGRGRRDGSQGTTRPALSPGLALASSLAGIWHAHYNIVPYPGIFYPQSLHIETYNFLEAQLKMPALP